VERMTAAALVAELRALGAVVELAGDRLRVRAPRGVLTEARRAGLSRHRNEITAMVRPLCGRPWRDDELDRIAWNLEADDRRTRPKKGPRE
jgi:tubulysin polyketide synthase-like protein